jgi:hypothetical protein
MKRFALDTTRASLIIVAVVVAAVQCCIRFKCKKEGEGKKTLKAFNPEIFFPAALVFHSSSEFFTKQIHDQHNETKQVKQASKQCAQKDFKLSLQFYPREITPVHHPTNPREISLECLIHFSIFGYHKRTRHSKYQSLFLCSTLNRNPKSSYSRYVEIHLMGIRILTGRRRKAAKTKAIRQQLPHPDRQTERNPEQRLFRVGRMFGALGGWSGLQVLVEKRRRSCNNKTICEELSDPDGQIDGKKEKNPKP